MCRKDLYKKNRPFVMWMTIDQKIHTKSGDFEGEMDLIHVPGLIYGSKNVESLKSGKL